MNLQNNNSLSNNLPLTIDTEDSASKQTAYLRSRVFTAHTGVNSLVTAAQPLITLVAHLKQSTQKPDESILIENLKHEITTFENRATQKGFDQQTIAIAKFAIICSLEESSYRRFQTEWESTQTPFQHFYQGQFDDQHLFDLLESLTHDSKQYIEVLELVFILLSLGFDQKFKQGQATIDIEKQRSALYQIIRHERGDQPLQLQTGSPQDQDTVVSEVHTLIPSPQISMIIAACFLVFTYFSFGYFIHLNKQLLPTSLSMNQHTVMSQQDDEHI